MATRKAQADYDYEIQQVSAFPGTAKETLCPVLMIVDKDLGNRSVTNDLEAVLWEIAARLPLPVTAYPMMYRDSMGHWDEIQIRGNYHHPVPCPLPRHDEFHDIMVACAESWVTRRNHRGVK